MIRALLFAFLSFAASAQQYVMDTVAGGVPPATPAPAAGVSIGDPPRVAVDAAGNAYFASLHSIFRVDRSGTLVRIAGTGRSGLTGDGGAALAAQLRDPVGIAVDATGNVYFTERAAGQIRRVSADGGISTFATGLSNPMGLAFDAAGNLYVAESGAGVVRRFTANGDSTVVAGNGAFDFSGDGGPAISAAFAGPEGVAFDSAGNMYIADTFNHRVRVVTTDGLISTFAGNGFPGFAGDGAAPLKASFILPTDVAVDRSGALYVADLGNSRIRKIAAGTVSTIAGNSGGLVPLDGLDATAARFSGPTGIAVDTAGAVYLAEGSIGSGSGLDGGAFKIWKINPNGKLATLAGTGLRSFSGDAGPASVAQFDSPSGIALDSKGNLYIADTNNNRIRRIAPDGTVTTVAGNALAGFSGESGPATLAQLNHPSGVAVDADGNLYIADTGNNRIRKVYANGIIGTLAGNGNTAYFGDGGSSLTAALNRPQGVAVAPTGEVYVADTGNHRVRKVINNLIDTVVDGLDAPTSVAIAADGSIAVADLGLGIVRVAGPSAAQATLGGARGVAFDSSGNLYATGYNRVIRMAPGAAAETIAGGGDCCYAGDGGPAGAALLNAPWGIAADSSGNLYIADTGNDAIRVASVSASTFFIRAVANAASGATGAVAPGEVVTIYGAGLGPRIGAAPATPAPGGRLPTQIAGTSVTFGGIPAPLLYANAGQVSAIVPYGVGGGSVDVMVTAGGVPTDPFPVSVAASAPGIFTADSTGAGPARAFNANGTANGPSHPALVGQQLTLYVTGEGQTTPAGVDGLIAGDSGAAPVLPVTVTIGGAPAALQSASSAPGLPAGVMQVVVTIPAGVTGRAPVVVSVGNRQSQPGVTVSAE